MQIQDLPLVCFTKTLQSESRLCRLGRSVSKQLYVIICSVEVIILYSKLEHSVDKNIEMLASLRKTVFCGVWGKGERYVAVMP